MKKITFILLFFLSANFLLCYELTMVSAGEANSIAQNWLAYVNKLPLQDKIGTYQISFVEQVQYKGNLLCEIYHLYPKGHIVVPSYRELVPIKSFSVVDDFKPHSKGYEYVVLEELKKAFDFLKAYRQGESIELENAIQKSWGQWDRFSQIELEGADLEERASVDSGQRVDTRGFIIKDPAGFHIESVTAEPLLKTRWGQGAPYGNDCPLLGDSRCKVGCVATAMAQIMRYYKWPANGRGSHSYYWENGNRTLSANFSDSYDWSYIPNTIGEYDTSQEETAVAEICYEAGVSINMRYGTSSSIAYIYDVANALKEHFKYSDEVKVVWRSSYASIDQWFEVLKKQRDLSRPLELAIYREGGGHAVVVDGYLITDDLKQVHINMGWNGSSNSYYTLDGILHYTKTSWQYAVVDIVPDGVSSGAAEIQLNKSSFSFSVPQGQNDPPPQTFGIRNSGGGDLAYQINDDRDWISVSPGSGSSTGEWDTITVTIDTSALPQGSYSSTVEVVSGEASNSPRQITLELTVHPPNIYAPLNFSGTRQENRSLVQIEHLNILSWDANPLNRDIEKYRIYLVEGRGQSLLVELDADTYTYWHRGVMKDKVYSYKLVAVDYINREGDTAFVSVQ